MKRIFDFTVARWQSHPFSSVVFGVCALGAFLAFTAGSLQGAAAFGAIAAYLGGGLLLLDL